MMKKLLCAAMAAVLCLSLLCACSVNKSDSPSQAPGKDVDLAAFAQTVMESHEFPGFMERIDPADEETGEFMAQMLDNSYPGLADLELEQLEVYMSMASFNNSELALVRAKSADDAAKVKDAFQARIDSKTTEGPGNYPAEVEIWLNGAKVVDHGNYVMLVCAQEADAIVEEFNALF